ncbi:MAG: two-component sensor histidine kinase [Sphingomonadales bacterium]|nr:MAG: two-component sensor histidine kinase [Sphingomonadales bacterium]
METRPEHPLAAILIAVATSVSLATMGVDLLLVAAVLTVWIGSLYLANARPPEATKPDTSALISRENMGELIQHSATPLLVLENNKITIANRAAQKILGKHIIGQDTRMAFRQPEAVSLLTKSKPGAAIVRGLVRRRDIWRINRQKIDSTMSVVELINLTAEADISRAHTDFVANASHELRTPLASIIGYVETLREGDGDLTKQTATKFLDTILKEARRLQSLVSDLMSLSRVEAEKHDQPSTVLELAKIVERAANDAAGSERQERLLFNLDNEIEVRGDAQQLEQLVRNLVDNALKYGRDGSMVSLSLGVSKEGQAKLVVSDEGEGIGPDHLPHLTRRFYRTDPGRSRASGGTGLGLAIVKHIVERHRGRLDIDSELGKGTSVTVRMPMVSTHAGKES